MNRIRIFVLRDDSAKSVFNAIKRLYPDMRKSFDVVEIEITFEKECKNETIVELQRLMKESKLLRQTDMFYYDFI